MSTVAARTRALAAIAASAWIAGGCLLTVDLDGLADAPAGVDGGGGGSGNGCESGMADCNNDSKDGCEVRISMDSANCGRCGHRCLEGTCTNGSCDPIDLASGADAPVALALDEQRVYWTEKNAVRSRFKNASGTAVLLADSQSGPTNIAVSVDDVFWTNKGGTVMSVPKTGGTLTTIATMQDGPTGIAVDASSVYWVTSSAVRKAPLKGGTPKDLAIGESGASALALGPAAVYWISFGDRSVKTTSKDGGTPQVIASNLQTPMAIGLDGEYVYIADQGSAAAAFADGSIARIPREGGALEVIKPNQSGPKSLAIQGGFLAWGNFNGLTVVTIPIPPPGGSAGATVQLAANQSGPQSVVLDMLSAYWISGTSIRKVAR